jgi:predicted transcriptional regulator of viral defense system
VRQDPAELRRTLSRVAAAQSGHFTSAQARAAGYSYPAQHYHVRRGGWQRLDRGIYRLADWPAGEHDDLVRWTLWSRGRGVVSHESALSVHDLGDVMPARVHLTVPPGFRSRAPGVVLHRGELPAAEVEEHEGFRVTSPLRSILDVAAGHINADQLARVTQEAVARGLTSPGRLRAEAGRMGQAGRRVLAALDLGLARS